MPPDSTGRLAVEASAKQYQIAPETCRSYAKLYTIAGTESLAGYSLHLASSSPLLFAPLLFVLTWALVSQLLIQCQLLPGTRKEFLSTFFSPNTRSRYRSHESPLLFPSFLLRSHHPSCPCNCKPPGPSRSIARPAGQLWLGRRRLRAFQVSSQLGKLSAAGARQD